MTTLRQQERKGLGPYPKPDRSLFWPKTNGSDPIYETDLGWAEGEFRDRRPYRAELWVWDHLVFITFFFSTTALERASQEDLCALLEAEDLIRFTGEKQGAAEKIVDFSGNEMWSVCVTLRGRGGVLAKAGMPFTPYRSPCSPETEKELAGMELFFPAYANNGGSKNGRPQ